MPSVVHAYPGVHGVGDDEPPGQYVPFKQPICVALDEPAGQYEPCVHAAVTAIKPTVPQYEPEVHNKAAVSAACGHTYPVGHGTGADAPAAQKLPAGHVLSCALELPTVAPDGQ